MTTLERFLLNHPALNRAGSQEMTTAVWGGIAQEYDALKAEISKITTNALSIDNLSADELDELIVRCIGIARLQNESDAMRLTLLKALFIRDNVPSWATVHSIRKVFRWWFPDNLIYIKEHEIETELITDGDFEPFDVGEKTEAFGTWTPSGNTVSIVASGVFEGARALFAINGGVASNTQSLDAGTYVLSLFYRGYCPVKIQRSSDGYYWNFESQSWAESLSGAELSNQESDYALFQGTVIVDSPDTVAVEFGPDSWDGIDGGDPTTEPTPPDPDVVFDGGYPGSSMTELLDGRSASTGFWVDLVSLGKKPAHPYIHVLVSAYSQSGGFLNNWSGADDPIAGTDYQNATFLNLDFIGGEGSGIPTEYYQAILDIVRPAGVKGAFDFIGRT